MVSLKNKYPTKLDNQKEIIIRKHFLVLQQDYMKYRSLYESFPDMCRTINTEGIILDCNESYAKSLGYTKEEVISKSIFDHVPEESFDAMSDSFKTWRKTGRVKNKEVLLKRKDGTIFPVIVSATNLYGTDGSILGSNTILRNISELHELRGASKAKCELEKKDMQKEKFTSMVTHDLKNLLIPIQLNCELLEGYVGLSALNSEQSECISEIFQASQRIDRLVSDIHDIHKLDMNQMKFNRKTINVKDLIDSITRAHLPLLNNRKIKFVNNSSNEILSIVSDEGRLFQVFSNLIKNAIDFLPKKNPNIEIGVLEQGKDVVFYTSDNGVGIPQDKQEKIFCEFFQVDEINTDRHIGSGLGLAICKGIIEELGGRLWLDSKVGKGTTFYFSIPKVGEMK